MMTEIKISFQLPSISGPEARQYLTDMAVQFCRIYNERNALPSWMILKRAQLTWELHTCRNWMLRCYSIMADTGEMKEGE